MLPDQRKDGPLALVLGASGYVGGRLVPRLLAQGYAVRCLARTPAKLGGHPWAGQAEIIAGDLLDATALPVTFAGADVVFHLAHPIGKAGVFAAADRVIAGNVAMAAEQAGVRRIVYLGGLGETASSHLRSRAEVGQILLDSPVPTTVLRAAVIIGSGSASFEMLRHLVAKFPVLLAPPWVRTPVQPIAIRDVLRYLVGVLDDPTADDHVFAIAGPDVLTSQAMMQQYAAVAGLPRPLVANVPVLTPRLSAVWVNLVTPVPYALARHLVLSLAAEVVKRPGGEDPTALVPGDCLSYAESVRLALGRIRDPGVATSWRDAEIGGREPADPYPGDPGWSGGTLLRDERTAETWAAPDDVFAAVTRVGGERGWPSLALLWEIRGLLDRMVGGVGLRRGRRDPESLRVGDALDFWRVEVLRSPSSGSGSGLLRLRAEMRVPGHAWLEWRVTATPTGSRLTQRALFAPKGLLGRLYWLAMMPFHPPIFRSMVVALARDAETRARTGGTAAVTSSGAPTGQPAGPVAGDGPPGPEQQPSGQAG